MDEPKNDKKPTLFQEVHKPDYCVDFIGDCSKCQLAISNSPLDCKGNIRRFVINIK